LSLHTSRRVGGNSLAYAAAWLAAVDLCIPRPEAHVLAEWRSFGPRGSLRMPKTDYATAAAGHRFQLAASDSSAWSVAHVSVEVSSDVVLLVDVSDVDWLDADVLAEAAST
jgi:hypothetical protein